MKRNLKSERPLPQHPETQQQERSIKSERPLNVGTPATSATAENMRASHLFHLVPHYNLAGNRTDNIEGPFSLYCESHLSGRVPHFGLAIICSVSPVKTTKTYHANMVCSSCRPNIHTAWMDLHSDVSMFAHKPLTAIARGCQMNCNPFLHNSG